MNLQQIGLFGGSFDPPHIGHVALVQAGLAIGLDEIWVIPACPVHRQLSGNADGSCRFDWLTRIFEYQPGVRVLDWEIRQGQPIPAVDTLRRFRSENPDTVPWLMLGADAWQGLPTWREYPAHPDLCNVAVFARQGEPEQLQEHAGWRQLDSDSLVAQPTAGHWSYVQAALPDISATDIRKRAKQGESLAGVVPEVVRVEIEQRYGL